MSLNKDKYDAETAPVLGRLGASGQGLGPRANVSLSFTSIPWEGTRFYLRLESGPVAQRQGSVYV